MRSSNPILSDKVFEGVRPTTSNDVMTIDGTVNKTLLSIGLTILSAYWAFSTPEVHSWMWPAALIGLVVALVTFFKASLAPYTTPIYALAEGVALGAISFAYSALYDGIVMQAVFLTFGVMLGMLFAYKSGLIKVTNTFRRVLYTGISGIFLFYIVSWGLSIFGVDAGFNMLNSSSPMGIGFSVLICGFAAFSLVLDFDRIEELATRGSAPKYMEWFCALGLLVTLVWLYLELLRLLAKLQSRD